jgi:phosphoglycolate phosphatase-like HAD superfamily hydrolase
MDAIVFDWDGTLVDSLEPLYAANMAVLASFGIAVDPATYRRVYTPDWRRMYQELGVPAHSVDEAGRRWSVAYGSGHGANVFPGVAAALARLAKAGYRMGLVTASTRRVISEQAPRFGLDAYLPVRVHAEDLPEAKPHPAPLERALAELGVSDPTRAAYVGDVPDDMRMARSVGAIGIGILGPMGTPSELTEAGASAVYPSVVAWVDEILGPGS